MRSPKTGNMWLWLASIVASPFACDRPQPSQNDSHDAAIAQSATAPATAPPPHLFERIVATQVGRRAIVNTDDHGRWEKRCSIHRPCDPFKPLERCDGSLSTLDPVPNELAGHEGKMVALRGTMSRSTGAFSGWSFA